jgi:hypothetical protein
MKLDDVAVGAGKGRHGCHPVQQRRVTSLLANILFVNSIFVHGLKKRQHIVPWDIIL